MEASLHPEPFHSSFLVGLSRCFKKSGSLAFGSPKFIHSCINVRELIGLRSVWHHPDTCGLVQRVLCVPRFKICLEVDDTSDESSALLNLGLEDRWLVTSTTVIARFTYRAADVRTELSNSIGPLAALIEPGPYRRVEWLWLAFVHRQLRSSNTYQRSLVSLQIRIESDYFAAFATVSACMVHYAIVRRSSPAFWSNARVRAFPHTVKQVSRQLRLVCAAGFLRKCCILTYLCAVV